MRPQEDVEWGRCLCLCSGIQVGCCRLYYSWLLGTVVQDQQSQQISLTHLSSLCVSHFSSFTEGVGTLFVHRTLRHILSFYSQISQGCICIWFFTFIDRLVLFSHIYKSYRYRHTMVLIYTWIIHESICDQSSPQTWTLRSVRHHLSLANLHVNWLLACPVFCFFFQCWWEKWGEARVNIDAHSVPSQPQSIWIHSSLWRTNNLEETLITPPPPPTKTSSMPCLSRLSLSSYLPFLCPCTLLSFYGPLLFSCNFCAILQDVLCSHFMYVFPVTTDELWMNIHGAALQISCCYTHPSALSREDIMIRLFNKCFYLKWTIMCGVFLAQPLKGFCWLFGFYKQHAFYFAASLVVAFISYCLQPALVHM